MVVLEGTSGMLVGALLALVTVVVLVDLSILGVVVWVGVLVGEVIRLVRPSWGIHRPVTGQSISSEVFDFKRLRNVYRLQPSKLKELVQIPTWYHHQRPPPVRSLRKNCSTNLLV